MNEGKKATTQQIFYSHFVTRRLTSYKRDNLNFKCVRAHASRTGQIGFYEFNLLLDIDTTASSD